MILVTECKLEIKSRKNRERNYRETERMVVDASASVLNTLCLLSNSLPYLCQILLLEFSSRSGKVAVDAGGVEKRDRSVKYKR